LSIIEQASHRHLLIVHTRIAKLPTPNFIELALDYYAALFFPLPLGPGLGLFVLSFPYTRFILIPNDGAIVFVPVVFVLFAFPFVHGVLLIPGVLCISKLSAVFASSGLSSRSIPFWR